jgi:site-specific recombinase XerD
VSGAAIYHRVITAGEHAGIDRVSPNRLRHTYARRLHNTSLSTETISEIMGLRLETVTASKTIYSDHFDPRNIDEYWEGSDRLADIGGS